MAPLSRISVLCPRDRYRTKSGRFSTSRALSACGGYIRPSVCQFAGSFGMSVISSSTAERVSPINVSAAVAEAASSAACNRRTNSSNRSFFPTLNFAFSSSITRVAYSVKVIFAAQIRSRRGTVRTRRCTQQARASGRNSPNAPKSQFHRSVPTLFLHSTMRS